MLLQKRSFSASARRKGGRLPAAVSRHACGERLYDSFLQRARNRDKNIDML